MASGNDRLLFLHVPKTGGNWVYEALLASGVELHAEGERHAGLADIQLNGRFSFCFVREPLSWYGSWWQHCRVIDPSWLEKAASVETPHIRFVPLPFDEYLVACMDHTPGFLAALYRRYTDVDFVGRYENLTDDLISALELSRQDFDEERLRQYPPINVSAPTPQCSDETKERLRVSEREIYERFYGVRIASSKTV